MTWPQFVRLLEELGLGRLSSEFSDVDSPAARVMKFDRQLTLVGATGKDVSVALDSLFNSILGSASRPKGTPIPQKTEFGDQSVASADFSVASVIGTVLDRLNQLEAKLEDRHRLLASRLAEFQANCWPNNPPESPKCGSVVAGTRTRPFDLFLSHNSEDRATVLLFRELLKAVGVYGLMDVHDIALGRNNQAQLDEALSNCRGGLIFLGASGIGRWQQMEITSLSGRFGRKGEGPLIPVFIHAKTAVPPTLAGLPRIDLFAEKEPVAAAQKVADALRDAV